LKRAAQPNAIASEGAGGFKHWKSSLKVGLYEELLAMVGLHTEAIEIGVARPQGGIK
jgi:hypothetical protein